MPCLQDYLALRLGRSLSSDQKTFLVWTEGRGMSFARTRCQDVDADSRRFWVILEDICHAKHLCPNGCR